MFYKLKKYGELNNYDLLKNCAFLFMFLDHLGLFIFSNYQIFRTVGRVAFPIYAILHGIGFKNKGPNFKLFFYGIILNFAMTFNYFIPIFPMNILLSFFIFDFIFEPYYKLYQNNKLIFCLTVCICLFFHKFLSNAFEYGTFPLFFMIVGRLFSKTSMLIFDIFFSVFIFLSYFVVESLLFNLTTINMIIFALFFSIVYLKLYNFTFREYYNIKSYKTLLFISRYSLELYFFHIVFLIIINKTLFF